MPLLVEEVIKDTTKNIMVFAPAGSGKTQSLAQRYVHLLDAGVPPQRILALTFTEDAASEMKARVMKILREEHPQLYKDIRPLSVRMRISTFHSFLRAFLLRFSSEAGIEFGLQVLNQDDSNAYFQRTLLKFLRTVSPQTPNFSDIIDIFIKGATEAHIESVVESIFSNRPRSDLIVSQEEIERLLMYDHSKMLEAWKAASPILKRYGISPDPIDKIIEKLERRDGYPNDLLEEAFSYLYSSEPKFMKKGGVALRKSFIKKMNEEEVPLLESSLQEFFTHFAAIVGNTFLKESVLPVYQSIFEIFSEMKRENGYVDFADMELLSILLLRRDPDIPLALYAFDESTDHILVDEFQDTNFLQWEVITHLTEEWRAGLGAKREMGIKPTIFVVGDDKQSIYGFRGANVAVFEKAKGELKEWFGKDFIILEKELNYRSLPAIIGFVNRTFSNIMKGGGKPWITMYRPFRSSRDKNRGTVELITYSKCENGERQNKEGFRKKEAEIIASRISYLLSNLRLVDNGEERPLEPKDIAILLRSKNYFYVFEDVLRESGIPSIVVGGKGFFQEPEIQVLLDLLYFIEDPTYDFGLYRFLYSPWGKEIFKEPWLQGFFESRGPLFHRLKSQGDHKILKLLSDSIALRDKVPIYRVIRKILRAISFYQYFPDMQSHANIEKFFDLLIEIESRDPSWSHVAEILMARQRMKDEGKGVIEEGGANGVQIMTIHAAKGLEFPIVFVSELDEKIAKNFSSGIGIIEREDAPRIIMNPQKYNLTPYLKYHPTVREIVEREREESKRLLYVASTRARDYLVFVAQEDAADDSYWGLLKEGLGLREEEKHWIPEEPLQGFVSLNEEDIKRAKERPFVRPEKRVKKPEISIPEPLAITTSKIWVDVTDRIRKKDHSFLREWDPFGTAFGEVFHSFLHMVSREGEILSDERTRHVLENAFKKEAIYQEKVNELVEIALEQWHTLREKDLVKQVVLGSETEGQWSELPFYLREGDTLWKGRIDRVLLRDKRVEIYDYKTFPVNEEKISEIRGFYKPQLEIYEKAVKALFPAKEVRSFLLLTATGEILSL